MAATDISDQDLVSFLDDVHSNIENDDRTDFKKLTLYLFGFAHKLIAKIANGNGKLQLLQRTFDTIELVLSKKKYLLNTHISPPESELAIEIPGLSSLFYEWGLRFGIHHLFNYSTNHDETSHQTINCIKSFIITIINLVTTQLHGFQYKRKLQIILISTIEHDLAGLFSSLTTPYDKDNYQSQLVRCTHLFSIINDKDISIRLLANIAGMPLKLETFARKLWFVLCNYNDNIKVVDELKSVLISNLTNNIVVEETAGWADIALVVSWLTEFRDQFHESSSSPPIEYTTFIRSWCCCLFKVFLICIDRQLEHSFMKAFASFNSGPLKLPHLLSNSIAVIQKRYAITNGDEIMKEPAPFNDSELDTLAAELLGTQSPSLDTMLQFYSPEFRTAQDPSVWISNVNQFLKGFVLKDNFGSRLTLYTLITALGNYSCLSSGRLKLKTSSCEDCDHRSLSKTNYSSISISRPLIREHPKISTLYSIFCEFMFGTYQQKIREDPILCTNVLLALYKILASYRPDIVSIADEPSFKFVLKCLQRNHNRDCRLLAARVLPLFLLAPKDDHLEIAFRIVFSGLVSIDIEKNAYLAESMFRALGELAIISEGEWLCAIFIKLIDLFGESNDHHVNMVYHEMLGIASAKSLTPYKVLSPFLPSVAERIVKHPAMFERITQLCGISKKYFLNRTKEYTTPRFLEYYKHDYIQDIAVAAETTRWKLIARNLPRIVATYICKDDEINESYILNVLANASPEFKSISMAELVSSIGEITWFVLLNIRINDKGIFTNEKQIRNALHYIAKANLTKTKSQNLARAKNFNHIEYLLGEHVLELVQRFSENVHHIKGTKPFLERMSSLRAIEFLITNNINASASALGQISTCLQAMLENADFELPALRCWNVLVQKLSTDHLISLFDILISLIFQKFTIFEHRSKIIAVQILKKLFVELRDKYTKYSLYYFSIPFIKDLERYFKLDSTFRNLMKPTSRTNYLSEFARRLQTHNEYVVHQALDDLNIYIDKYQLNCQSEDFQDNAMQTYVANLIRTLLDTSSKFKSSSSDISKKCAKALSLFGALDPNRFALKTFKSQVIVVHDFEDYRENAAFLRHFIENKVLKVFWASNDPVKQLFSAYSMQTFLEVLKLDASVLNPSTQDPFTDVWKKFSDVAKSTLTPLLSSKYVSPVVRYEPLKYPHFKIGLTHEKWLVDVTATLLKRPVKSIFKDGGSNSTSRSTIFQTCSMLIRDHDISICDYLLKYVVLSHVINGDEEVINDIRTEFLYLLNVDNSELSPDRSDQIKLCYQSVFEVLDYFNDWVSSAIQYMNDYTLSKTETSRMKKRIDLVSSFLDGVPMELIAIKSAECNSYERTILYLEKCYRDGRVNSENQIGELKIVPVLQSMYANLNDFDALSGILRKFSTNNLNEKLTTFQYNDNWTFVQSSFQALSELGDKDEKIENQTKLLKSLANHAMYDDVLSTLAVRTEHHDLSAIPFDWSMAGLSAATISGSFDQLKKWLYVADSIGKFHDVGTSMTYQFAQALNAIVDLSDEELSKARIDLLYDIIGKSLLSSVSSSTSRNAALLSHLHNLYDMSSIIFPDHESDSSTINNILKVRLKNADQAFDSQWAIVSMQSVAHKVKKENQKVADNLLFKSELARKNHRFDLATQSIVKAMALNDGRATIEYADLLWDQGKHTEAIKSIEQVLTDKNIWKSISKAKVQLKYAEWLDESSHSSSTAIIAEYTKAYRLDANWEKPYYDLGKYYNKLMDSQNDSSGIFEQHLVRYFLKALALGPTYIFEALPKLITVWLDFAQTTRRSGDSEKALNQIVQDIGSVITKIPAYVWYTAITQLLSRVGHAHQPSADLLHQIIARLVETYPRHSLWFVLSHLNSNDKTRRDRVSLVLKSYVSTGNDASKILSGAQQLFQTLKKLANFKISKKSPRKMSLADDFGITSLNEPCTSLVIPVRSNLEIRLPSVKHVQKSSSAFPKSSSITFNGFDDAVNVFHSLQMPRQVTIRGSDFQVYRLMIKKDDTRKDAKVVEFTTMINRLLSADNESRKRNLTIANYSVVPLAENMGVIEFVSNVDTMKGIINEQRKKRGQMVNDRKMFLRLDSGQKAVKSKSAADRKSIEDLIALFEDICHEAPPVLHAWLVNQFSDPSSWYLARTAFTRSTAVMSIVGYIIGLGDRHCENILFFKKTGAALHIDFDCLFEKGKTLPTPEIVPFRLTQNMVDVMSISGVEGSFRISCEVTGSILRENEAPLMNNLETLLYDPLLDWRTQQDPQDHLRTVRRKIRGLMDEKEGLPMNINGQVDVLIQEATSTENLSQMYGGWAPYI
ncbi:hypothetical protein PGUG_02812 [Meyerozyma guilliermondii ATCC 6260]|uniref:Serine/threonine-protein kinase MEC1 n=1 Tax=Meyerozyma guilliermondii (strain ATCC 6260 / CBS 566 / DSM 6381 / JCM 1539 / NBRC 10279 / NRRL Y-324) TaxID=294746 RepID=A5DHR1_PICGU|nr:uncharacterized protein PGUG_02812 [Meyerozyma guilliermondii ATCC 6260]EDK38714.2 hypothetical protein PGUG_02812 [Meyerozyma guilliermondii ATCC 6260]